jgi:hypothetical protein
MQWPSGKRRASAKPSVESVVAATNTICYAEDLNAAAKKDGEQGVRILLKKIAHDMRTKIEDAFDAIAAEMADAQRGDVQKSHLATLHYQTNN